ncbi:MAG: efflux RND transporter periplasmic adaptor subunit [Myxococcota bacterium]
MSTGTRPDPKRTHREDRGTLVEVMTVSSGSHRLTVRAQGTVVAARLVELRPEISGRIVWQSRELAAGGKFKAGQSLLRIDPRDYELALEQQRASVDRAQLDLEVERGRKVVAEREWALLGDGSKSGDDGRALALREPQLRTARVGLKAAKSGLKQAEITLERTIVRAPFNAFVQEELADLGQLVTPASRLGSLIGTDQFWVQVSIPVERLPWVDLPGADGKGGSTVRVIQKAGALSIERSGRVIRLLGDLDPIGRMARLVVAVDDPLGLASNETKDGDGAPQLPLLLGAYVRVEIDGEVLHDAIEIPRLVLRQGDRVYVMDDGDTLSIRNVVVAWRRSDTVLIRGGLRPGERVIVSRVPTPLPGMALRAESTPAAEAKLGAKTDAPATEKQ